MVFPEQAAFELSPEGLTPLIDDIEKIFAVTLEKEERTTLRFMDSFDWRLFKNQQALCFDGHLLFITGLTGRAKLYPTAVEHPPRFVWDLPAGPLRSYLESTVAMRALLERSAIRRTVLVYRVLNEDQKTVMALEAEQDKVLAGQVLKNIGGTLYLRPLRGYDAEWGKVNSLLTSSAASGGESVLLRAYGAEGLRPGAYSSKMKLRLQPEMTAAQALRKLYLRLLKVMRQNIDGICHDVDSEFLHDFRVSVRRTRSGLAQLKGVFDSETMVWADERFRLLGRRTNLMRDLDVYLLAREQYRQSLPAEVRPGIDLFFDHLQEQRKTAQRELSLFLKSEEHLAILNVWRSFLKEEGNEHDDWGNKSVKLLADQAIRRRFRRICRDTVLLESDSRNEAYHDLRIQCKKLRYLLEFFASLYPPADMEALVDSLKNLQTGLGDFNDLHVQQETLKHMADEMKLLSKEIRPVLFAVGILVGMLHERERNLKPTLLDAAKTFSLENRKTFKRLFPKPTLG